MRLPSHSIDTPLQFPSSSHSGALAHDVAARVQPAVSAALEASLTGSLFVATLHGDDLPALQALRERVLTRLPDPDFYRRENNETAFLQTHIDTPHLCLAIKENTHLVAYGMLDFPLTPVTVHAAGRDYDDIDAMCNNTPQLISCMVDPDFRGRGLQRYLINARIDAGVQRGAGRFWAMVAPSNNISRDNLSAAGFTHIASREIDGHMRHIMMLICHPHSRS